MVEVLTDIKRKINKRFTTQRRRKKKPQQNQKLNHKMDQDSYHFTALIDMSRLLYFGSIETKFILVVYYNITLIRR